MLCRYVLKTQQINLDYARRLVADVPEERMADQPRPGMNHAAWVLGHLAMTADFVSGILGDATIRHPESWEALFGSGATPVSDRSRYPSKAELVHAVESAYQRVASLLPKVSEARLAEPFPMEEMREMVPSVGDGVVFLVTAHDAVHLGQLSAWRRAMGLPSV